MNRFARWARKGRRRAVVYFGTCILIGLGIGLGIGSFVPEGVMLAVASVGAVWCLVGLQRVAREQGYWEARLEMLDGLAEAQRRGIDFADWLRSDIERAGLRAAYGPPSRRTLRLAEKQRRIANNKER